jgi:hypothetical protein
LCIGAGLLFWLILYFKDNTFKEVAPVWRALMIACRSLATGILLYLILAPLFKSVFTEVKKPIIVIAQDNSQSLTNNWSKEKQQQYLTDKNRLESTLSKSFEVLPITFGEKITEGSKVDFNERATDISAVLDYIQNQTAGQNLGAIILATDGNYNQGRNPLYSNPGLSVPVYTVALGDSTVKRDASITRILNNSIIYLGDQFEVQMDIKAVQMNHEKINLQVFRVDGNSETLLKSEPVEVNTDDWYHTHKFVFDANRAGTVHYIARISPIPNEYSRENNIKDFFVDVLDARQKILILAASPHPDLAVFKKILEGNKNYSVDILIHSGTTPNLNDYNLVIFHQLPSKTTEISTLLRDINKSQKPRLFVLGAQSDLSKFNGSQTILKVIGDSRNMNEVAGDIKESFSLFTPDPSWKEFFRNFPPVSAPFGEYMVSPGTQTLITQKIGNILTNYPLLMIGEDQGIRTAILATEGWWKWRYFNFLEHKNFEVVDDLFKKVIQYIGIKEDKRKFRVTTPQKVFLENQSVTFDAQLFNESYQLINTDDVTITISSGAKKEYQFTFNKSGNGYILDAGLFAPGTYHFIAVVNTKSGRQEVKGQFVVQKIQLETYQNTADHNILRLLSAQQGGVTVSPDQIVTLGDLINENKTVRPVQYNSQRTYPIINFKWLFGLLASLLCIEWFLRRYHGAY